MSASRHSGDCVPGHSSSPGLSCALRDVSCPPRSPPAGGREPQRPVTTIKNVSGHCQTSPEGKIAAFENYTRNRKSHAEAQAWGSGVDGAILLTFLTRRMNIFTACLCQFFKTCCSWEMQSWRGDESWPGSGTGVWPQPSLSLPYGV